MARRRGPNLPEGDDGKTIVDMNVDGMPWYLRRSERAEGRSLGETARRPSSSAPIGGRR